MADSLEDLLHASTRTLAQGAWKPRLAELVRGLDAAAVTLEIHPGDQMLTHSLVNHGDADTALSQYFAISAQQLHVLRQIVAAHFGEAAHGLKALDFACGYGRLLRLLPAVVPARNTWASDIQADAVQFVAATFGVQGIASHAEPARFEPAQRFDLVWVASLFSHLPEGLFVAWLERLARVLTPRGVLCFSVRDVSQLPAGGAEPESGLQYVGQSENADLDTEIYGTAYASEAFVARVLAQVAPGRAWARIPRALANEQDLYLLGGEAVQDLAFAPAVRRGPWGWVDIKRHHGARLELQGWAASLDDGAVSHVEIRVDGELHRVLPGVPRPDVAQVLGDPRTALAGWNFETGMAGAAVSVDVRAVDRAGDAGLLFAGTIRPP